MNRGSHQRKQLVNSSHYHLYNHYEDDNGDEEKIEEDMKDEYSADEIPPYFVVVVG